MKNNSDTQTVRYQPGVLLRGSQLSGGVSKLFLFLYPFFKPLKISFNLMCTAALSESFGGNCARAPRFNAVWINQSRPQSPPFLLVSWSAKRRARATPATVKIKTSSPGDEDVD